MSVYHIILLCVLLQISILGSDPQKTNKINYEDFRLKITRKNLIEFFFIIDIFFMAFLMYIRDIGIGTDLSTYLYYHNVLGNTSPEMLLSAADYRGLEYGYAISFKIIYWLNSSTEAYMLVTSCLIVAPLYYFLKKRSTNVLFSLLLFICFGFFNSSLNIIRQFIALGILLTSFDQVEKRRFMPFLLKILLAMSFHNSAIIFLIMYPLYNFKLSKKNLQTVCITLITSFFIFSNYISLLIINISGYEKYTNRSGAFGFIMIIEILITFVYIFFYNEFTTEDKEANVWVWMSLITICLGILGLKMDLFYRLSVYFQIGYIISIPRFINLFKNNQTKFISRTIVIAIFSIYYIYALANSSLGETIPYLTR